MYKKILFPIDISDEESCAVAFPAVIELVKAFNAELHVLTVVPDYGMSMVQQYFPKGWLDEIINTATSDLHRIVKKYTPSEITAHEIIGRGAVYESILDTAETKVHADLIALHSSSSRPGERDYLLGPNAAKVVRHAKKSVFIIR